MGILHAAIFNRVPGASLVAVAEQDSRVRSVASKVLTKARTFSSHQELLEQERPDVLVVTTPTYLHAAVIRDAVAAGTDIFCEKPIAPSYREAVDLAALTSGRKTMAGFQKRFVPTFARARQLVTERDALGEIVRIRGFAFLGDVFHATNSWRFQFAKGGGALTEWGIHLADLLLWFFGNLRIRAAFQRHPFSVEADDYTHCVFETSTGALGTMDVSWSHRGTRLPELGLEIEGTTGSLSVTDDKLVLDLGKPSGPSGKGTTTIYRAQLEDRVDFLLGFPEFFHEDRAFIDSIVRQEQPPIPFAAATQVHRVLDEIRHLATASGGGENGANP